MANFAAKGYIHFGARNEPKNFFAELRAHVYKVAVAYALAAGPDQIATQCFPFLKPHWAVRLVVLAIVIGFQSRL